MMIIINQKGEAVINFDKVNFLDIENDFEEEDEYVITAHCLDSDIVEIGTYKNEKFAKKVLREIYANAIIGNPYLDIGTLEEKEEEE